MDEEDALGLLGLEQGASWEEVDRAYKQASKHLHPNALDGGDRERWEELWEARESLRHGSSTDLVPVRVALELIREQERALDRRDRRQERAAESESASHSIVRRHTSRLNERKRSAWGLGVVSAGLTLLTALLKAIVFTDTTLTQSAFITGAISGFGLATIVFGMMGLGAQARADRLGHAIEDVTAQLSQRAELLRLLNEIRRVSEVDLPWSPKAFDDAIQRWSREVGSLDYRSLASTAEEIGPHDFGRLLISKGLELELLVEETQELDGEPGVSYEFSVALGRV